MSATTESPAEQDVQIDQRIVLPGVTYADYEAILRMRGDRSGVRVTFWNGSLELMSPSRPHERIAEMLGHLLMSYALERDVAFNSYGSWTLRTDVEDESSRAGAEADKCFIIGGGDEDKSRPDLAIEVVWTHGGIDKLEVYARLGVPEVWFWNRSRITVHRLGENGYATAERSELLPDIDLAKLAKLAERTDQVPAVREWREHLRRPADSAGDVEA